MQTEDQTPFDIDQFPALRVTFGKERPAREEPDRQTGDTGNQGL
ncbi:hypothetical protein [Novosphingobium sp. ZW T3_23]